jgi:hypothetical protein
MHAAIIDVVVAIIAAIIVTMHCQGGEDNIEQAYYYFAFQRNLVEDELKWEVSLSNWSRTKIR